MRVVHPGLYLKSQERKKKGRSKRFGALFLLALIIGSYFYMVSRVRAEYEVSKIYRPKVTAQPVVFDWPATGSAAIGYLDTPNKAVASFNGKQVLPTASTIKLLTAVVVLSQKPLGPGEDGERIYFNNADVERTNAIIAVDGSYFPITNGMSMSYHQALEVMLIGSANNISEKLAILAFGGLEEYKKAANSYLASNSITNTNVDDTSGLSSATTSTAEDMMRISLLAMGIPVIREVVDTVKTDVNGINIVNTNKLLGAGDIDGIKTGYTLEAGGCLLLSKTVDGNLLVAVVMGLPSREVAFAEGSRLLNVVADNFVRLVIVADGDLVAEMKSPWGTITKVEAQTSITAYKWKDETVLGEVDIKPQTEGLRGDKVGVVTYRSQAANLVLADDLPKPGLWWKMTHVLDAVRDLL